MADVYFVGVMQSEDTRYESSIDDHIRGIRYPTSPFAPIDRYGQRRHGIFRINSYITLKLFQSLYIPAVVSQHGEVRALAKYLAFDSKRTANPSIACAYETYTPFKMCEWRQRSFYSNENLTRLRGSIEVFKHLHEPGVVAGLSYVYRAVNEWSGSAYTIIDEMIGFPEEVESMKTQHKLAVAQYELNWNNRAAMIRKPTMEQSFCTYMYYYNWI